MENCGEILQYDKVSFLIIYFIGLIYDKNKRKKELV